MSAPKFTKGFGRFVCFGDSIECEAEGFTVRARIEHDAQRGIDDDDCHPAEYSEEIFGTETVESRAQFEQALAARNAWLADEWHYCGVVLSVERNGVMLDQHAASLWGVECNYPVGDNSYLLEVANELLPEALDGAREVLEKLRK
jgi:hypothetical protein